MKLVRPLSVAVAAAPLVLFGFVGSAEAAGHKLQCGPKQPVGKVAVQTCTQRSDGRFWKADHVVVSIRLYNHATTNRTVSWRSAVAIEGGDWQYKDGRTTVAPGSIRFMTRDVDDLNHNLNVDTAAVAGYQGRWSEWSTNTSVGD